MVNDVTQLNPITVSKVIVPRTTEEIVDAVRQSAGPITIGGALHSMGGQTAAPDALHLDMRHFDKVLVRPSTPISSTASSADMAGSE